jgi:hypothetical protein
MAKRDLYECAKDAIAMAPSETHRTYSGLVTKKTPSKKVVAICMSTKGYEYTPLAPGEAPHDPWTGGAVTGWGR